MSFIAPVQTVVCDPGQKGGQAAQFKSDREVPLNIFLLCVN